MKKSIWLKLFTVVIAVSMLLSLFSCNATEDPENTETQEEQENTNYDEIYKDPYEVFEELASRGYTGTFEEWVESLKGEDGEDGEDGKSAYELAVANGYVGTEAEWIASLAGMDGTAGKSAYELAVDNGYTGTVEEWLVSLVGKDGANGSTPFIKNGTWWIGTTDTGIKVTGQNGAKGDKGDRGEKGEDGEDGEDGITPHIGKNGNWWIGTTDTGVKASGSSSGSTGSSLADDSIITLNKDMESFVIQAASGRPEAFGDKYEVLQFVHASDMHARPDMWNRMVEWINYYDEYISFAIHTGDYVGGDQATFENMYEDGDACNVPILNLPGNHDTAAPGQNQKQQTATKQSTHELLFGDWCYEWGVTFMDGDYSMSYYQDFPESNVRLIALDLYYDIDAQKVWLKGLLDEAKEKGMHVITAMHEPSANIAYPLDTPFHTYNYDLYSVIGKKSLEDVIIEFKNNGGIHIANLVGHEHHDLCGYTLGGILNIGVESGTPWDYWCDGVRVEGSKTFDAFNVVSVDTNAGVIKVIRIGNNTDPYMREKDALCYDYINKKIIAGGTVSSSDSSSGMPEDDYEAPDYVNAYLNPTYLASRPAGGSYQVSDEGLKTEDDVLFTRIAGQDKVGQIFWTRIGGNSAGSWPSTQINPISVGEAKYLIIKMRGKINVSSLALTVGTIKGDATYENRENMASGDIKLPQSVIYEDEWTYFVIDFENTWSNYWVANDDGTYNVAYLQLTLYSSDTASFTTDSYMDLAYMAFLDSWAEVSDFLEVDTVQVVNASNSSVEVDVATGKCKDAHAVAETVSGNTYTWACTLCETVIDEKTVPESVNWYSPLSSMNVYINKLEYNLYDSENDVMFNRYSGSQADHFNITGSKGAGQPTAESYQTGSILVMKYRGSSTGSLKLYASTDAAKVNVLDTNYVGIQGSVGYPNDEWRIAVVDLSDVVDYSCNSTAPIYVMLNATAGTYTFDIAYVAIVDSMDEAKLLIGKEGYVDYGKLFGDTGTKYNGDGEIMTDTEAGNDDESDVKVQGPASEDFQLSAQDIASAATNNGYALGTVEIKNDESFEYVRIYNNDTSTENAHWAYSYADAEGNSGQYLIFKYRTNVTTGWMQFATSSSALIGDFFSEKAQRSWYVMANDTEWHTVIVDMGQSVGDDGVAHFLENGTENLAAKFIGFRPFYDSASNADAYMDFAYVKWAVTLEEAYEAIGEESNVDAGYYKGGKWYSITAEITQ